jgi:hypothetical protein
MANDYDDADSAIAVSKTTIRKQTRLPYYL